MNEPTSLMNKKYIPLYIVTFAPVITCLFIFLSAYYVFPLTGGDAIHFIPPAIRYATGLGFDNPIYAQGFDFDPEAQNQARFTGYPPLFALLIAWLMPQATAQAAFIVCAIFRIVAIVWLGFLLVKIANRTKTGLNYTVAIVIALILFSYGGMFLPTMGRPEILAAIFVLAGITVVIYARGWREAILQGCVLGLMGATHPAGAVISVALFGLSCAVKYRSKEALRQTIIATTIGVLICIAIISIGPIGLADTLTGLRIHSAYQLTRSGSMLAIIKYWTVWTNRFFFGPILIFCLFLFCVKSLSRLEKVGSPLLFILWLLTIVYLIWFFGVRIPEASYNCALFQPVVYCVLLDLLFRVRIAKIDRKQVSRSLVCIMLLVSLVSPVRTILMYQQVVSTSKTYAEAKKQLETYIADGQFVFFTGSFWTLSEDYPNMWKWEREWKRLTPPPSGEKFLLQQEAYPDLRFPPPEDASLVLDWRYSKSPQLFGLLPLAKTPVGYGFSLWKLNDDSANQVGKSPLSELSD